MAEPMAVRSSGAAGGTCDVSVVVPALNEAESLPELVRRLEEVLGGGGRSFEILVIDDGSSDGTYEVVQELAASRPWLHAIGFSRNYGKAAALSAGFKSARGRLIVTMDADLQDDPREVPRLLEMIEQEGYDLVSGWKQDRKDSFVKNKTSRLFNTATGLMSGLRLHDFNCGLKAYRAEVVQTVRVYGEMHRYIPALAHLEGFRVGELPVCHHKRLYGKTKYGANRFLNGFFDLLTVMFLSSRSTSPLHFFGRLGVWFMVPGLAINAWFLGQWLLGYGLRLRPLLLLGAVLIIVAIQFVSLGLVAELIAAGNRPESRYHVRRHF